MKIEKLIGRKEELKYLSENYELKRSGLVAIYGRRRIGKSFLLEKYCKHHDGLYFEGLENQSTLKQIEHFTHQLASQLNDDFLKSAKPQDWRLVFDFLTKYFSQKKKKVVIVFDEFQWMAAGLSSLVALLKFYWDVHWKKLNVQLILCGSISSYMIKKVIRSKALYGRIDLQICIRALTFNEICEFHKEKISDNELLKYMLIFGGVPKYHDLIDPKYSFEVNVQSLCFNRDSFFSEEFNKIFYSQFKKHTIHEKIINFLSITNLSLEEISKKLNMSSSGALKRYITELEGADFIRMQTPYTKKPKKYKLCDEFLVFYFKYIKPNQSKILLGHTTKIFTNNVIPKWSPWLGIAFENFVFKNLKPLTTKMKINDGLDLAGSYISYGVNPFQIDLLLKTAEDHYYICECKYSQESIRTSVIKEFERKRLFFSKDKNKSVHKVLITVNGVSRELIDLEYFDFIFNLEDFRN
jgi:AAA+ ATPase superfamily predicted ATPase